MIDTAIFANFQYNMTNEKIKNIPIDAIENTYDRLHSDYMQSFNSLGNKPENMEDYFSWFLKKININIVYYQTPKKISTIFFFSKSNRQGTIITHDLIREKLSYETLSLHVKKFVSSLIQENLLDVNPEQVINVSFFGEDYVLYKAGTSFFDREYRENFLPQLKSQFETLKFNTSRIHQDIYDFNTMIKIINNDQFTLELEECLYAYEEEKSFIASAGLGSVLEHLLYLAIEKHVPEKENNIHENSTASDYIGQLKKDPFKMNKREATDLKGTFTFRNSFSHFNKGYFNKSMCDQLLNGIKISFDKYYMFISSNTET